MSLDKLSEAYISSQAAVAQTYGKDVQTAPKTEDKKEEESLPGLQFKNSYLTPQEAGKTDKTAEANDSLAKRLDIAALKQDELNDMNKIMDEETEKSSLRIGNEKIALLLNDPVVMAEMDENIDKTF